MENNVKMDIQALGDRLFHDASQTLVYGAAKRQTSTDAEACVTADKIINLVVMSTSQRAAESFVRDILRTNEIPANIACIGLSITAQVSLDTFHNAHINGHCLLLDDLRFAFASEHSQFAMTINELKQKVRQSDKLVFVTTQYVANATVDSIFSRWLNRNRRIRIHGEEKRSFHCYERQTVTQRIEKMLPESSVSSPLVVGEGDPDPTPTFIVDAHVALELLRNYSVWHLDIPGKGRVFIKDDVEFIDPSDLLYIVKAMAGYTMFNDDDLDGERDVHMSYRTARHIFTHLVSPRYSLQNNEGQCAVGYEAPKSPYTSFESLISSHSPVIRRAQNWPEMEDKNLPSDHGDPSDIKGQVIQSIAGAQIGQAIGGNMADLTGPGPGPIN